MRRLIATGIIASLMLFGATHVAMADMFSHASPSLHEVMGSSASCMLGECPAAAGHRSAASDCQARCLGAARSETSVPPVLPALFAVLFVLLAGRAVAASSARNSAGNSAFAIGKLLTRQRLATVVLRN